MKVVELVALAIRVGAILLLVDALNHGPLVSAMLQRHVEMSGVVVASIGLYIACSAIMILFPVTIAHMLVPKSSRESPEVGVNGGSLEYVAFMVLGIYILSFAIPDAVDTAIRYASLDAPPDYYPAEQLRELKLAAVYTSIQLAIALYLVFGAPKIVSILRRLRAFGA